jgi:hypothetical protein
VYKYRPIYSVKKSEIEKFNSRASTLLETADKQEESVHGCNSISTTAGPQHCLRQLTIWRKVNFSSLIYFSFHLMQGCSLSLFSTSLFAKCDLKQSMLNDEFYYTNYFA